MNRGNWIPISKALAGCLPHGRAYSKVEAAYSLQVDYDDGVPVTVAGYAALWRWSRKKVRLFLKQLGVELLYPEDTKKRRNQKGHIRVHKRDIKGIEKGHIRLIDSKGLADQRDISGGKKGHKRDIKGNTTTYPNPNPKKYYCPFPLKDGTDYQVKSEQTDKFKPAYPDINLESEFLKIAAWCQSNPDKLKTRRGAPRFLNNWLANAQERAAKDRGPSIRERLDSQPSLEELTA